jgi:hypothetical protein
MLELVFKAHGLRREHEWKVAAWSAWHIEALARMKKLPPLDRFLGIKKRTPKQTPEEMMAILSELVGGPPEAEA